MPKYIKDLTISRDVSATCCRKGEENRLSWRGNPGTISVGTSIDKVDNEIIYAVIEAISPWDGLNFISMEAALSIAMDLFSIVEKNRPDLIKNDD